MKPTRHGVVEELGDLEFEKTSTELANNAATITESSLIVRSPSTRTPFQRRGAVEGINLLETPFRTAAFRFCSFSDTLFHGFLHQNSISSAQNSVFFCEKKVPGRSGKCGKVRRMCQPS